MQINNLTNLQTSKNIKIAIVKARFNQEITDNLLLGALQSYLDSSDSKTSLSDLLKQIKNSKHNQITLYETAGSVEIPLIAQECARKKSKSKPEKNEFDAVLSLGSVIRGETPHFDYVCKMLTEGLSKAGLENQIPIIFGVLTVNNLEQAKARSSLTNLPQNAGYTGLQTALEMVHTIRKIRNPE